KWSVQIERADEIAPVLRRAFKVASDTPKGPVFVSLPIDVLEQETSVEAVAPDRLWRASAPDPAGVAELAQALLKSQRPTIVAGGCGAGPQGVRRYGPRCAAGRAVLRGHLACGRRTHSPRRARDSNRGVARTPRVQQSPRCGIGR